MFEVGGWKLEVGGVNNGDDLKEKARKKLIV
jgi:hypothetical protein